MKAIALTEKIAQVEETKFRFVPPTGCVFIESEKKQLAK